VCIAVGIDQRAGYGASSAEASTQLRAAVVDACVASGLQRILLTLQRDDNAQVALLPAGIDEPRAIAGLTAELAACLRKINRHRLDGARLRVTMAVHEGITTLEADGYHGYAISKACQLAGSDAVSDALMAHSGADLAVLLSDRIFDDISRLGVPGLRIAKCQRVEISDPVGEHRDYGWIYIPPHLVNDSTP
jgi:hypothetical protein